MKVQTLFIVTMAVVLNGCATVEQYKAIPLTDSEFAKPIEDLRADYSDVPRYESYWRGISGSFGDLNDLEAKWGKPDSVETKWGEKAIGTAFGLSLAAAGYVPVAAFLALEAMFIYPPEDHYWTKHDTQVRAEVIRTGTMGYEPRIRLWEWKKITGGAAKEKSQITSAEQDRSSKIE